ncbi:M14 family zinc carboxypeptidase [Paenibacillus hodogayensis]|uniref:M14 family zinc carboxypeptidase n=1 Tax=Paenibacillus hodogayensis TaxID=279208 RepID=A0ABV5VRW4_9BACL
MLPIRIDCHYAGGNIRIVSAEEGLIRLEQDIRDTTEWWFYWNFRATVVSRSEQETVFEFVNGEVVGPWGPAVSDDGISWSWLGSDSLLSRTTFRFRFTETMKQVYFAFSLPYQEHHFERFYSGIAADPRVRRDVLTQSEQLRSVPLLRVGSPSASQHILVTCRHHACESTPSYLMEGLLNYYLAQPESQVLNEYLFHYIPFVDIDGVENGDQGKSRSPHDHNRDYTEAPVYRSTTAIIEYARQLRPTAGIDLHGPYKWGGRNDVPFLVKQDPPVQGEIERLSLHLERITAARSTPDAIRHRSADDIDMGVEWNQPHGKNASAAFRRAGARLAFTLEFPYFGKGEIAITIENSRQFGEDTAKALEAYLLESP